MSKTIVVIVPINEVTADSQLEGVELGGSRIVTAWWDRGGDLAVEIEWPDEPDQDENPA